MRVPGGARAVKEIGGGVRIAAVALVFQTKFPGVVWRVRRSRREL